MSWTGWFYEQKELEGSRNKQTKQKQKGHWLFQNYPACNAETGWEMGEHENNWLASIEEFHIVSFEHLYCSDLNWPVRETWLPSCQVKGMARFWLGVGQPKQVSLFSLTKPLGPVQAFKWCLSSALCSLVREWAASRPWPWLKDVVSTLNKFPHQQNRSSSSDTGGCEL